MNASSSAAAQAAAAQAAEIQAAILAAFDANTILGDLQIGVLIAYALFGIATAQAYRYYTSYPNDSIRLKLLVALVWLCEAAHVACVGQNLYLVTITDYAHPERLGDVSTPMLVSVLFTGIIAAIVQAFFAVRIWSLFKTKPGTRLLGFILLITILTLALSLPAFSIVPFVGSPSVTTIEEQQAWIVYTVLGISAVNDLLITAAIVGHLYGERSHAATGTIVILDKLIKWSIETGVITSVVAILSLVLFITKRQSFAWLAVEVVVAKLYSNSLLASLNSRATLRALRAGQSGQETSGGRSRSHAYPLQVNVSTNVDRDITKIASEGKFSPNGPHHPYGSVV